MNEELKDNMISEDFARDIALRVVDRLQQKRKHLFVLYTGARLGCDEALTSMEKLALAGYTFDVLYSDSASRVLDLPRIQRTLKPTRIISAAEQSGEGVIDNPFSPLVVPTMTTRTTAHIAMLAADTESAKFIQNSLMHGRDVIIAADGSCPDCWKARGFPITPVMAEQMSKNLKQVEAYGAVLANARGLHRAVMRLNGDMPEGGKAVEVKKTAVQAMDNPQAKRKESGIVSAQDIVTMQPGSTLAVGKGCLITQLAKDMAAQRNINICKE